MMKEVEQFDVMVTLFRLLLLQDSSTFVFLCNLSNYCSQSYFVIVAEEGNIGYWSGLKWILFDNWANHNCF